MEKVRVAIIGCGKITMTRHAPEYCKNQSVEIKGFYDSDYLRANTLVQSYGGRIYDSVDDILGDSEIDAVSICVPNHYHASLSIKSLMSGKHVLCEKPMAINLEESRQMLAAEAQSGKVLMIGHNQRLLPTHQKAHELLSTGAIGKPLSIQSNFKHGGPENWSVENSNKTWFFKRDQANFGVLGDLGSHKIDIIRYITGLEVRDIFTMKSTLDKRYNDGHLIDLEDNAVCIFHMIDGTPCVLNLSWTNYGEEDNSTIIYGTRGVMKIFGGDDADIVLEMIDHTTVKYNIGAIQTNTYQTSSGVIDEFITAILEHRRSIVTGIDGHNTLAVMIAANQSAELGKWIEVRY